jgi:hypothetical protein
MLRSETNVMAATMGQTLAHRAFAHAEISPWPSFKTPLRGSSG